MTTKNKRTLFKLAVRHRHTSKGQRIAKHLLRILAAPKTKIPPEDKIKIKDIQNKILQTLKPLKDFDPSITTISIPNMFDDNDWKLVGKAMNELRNKERIFVNHDNEIMLKTNYDKLKVIREKNAIEAEKYLISLIKKNNGFLDWGEMKKMQSTFEKKFDVGVASIADKLERDRVVEKVKNFSEGGSLSGIKLI